MNKQIDAKVIIDDTIYSTSNEEDRKYLKEVLHDIGYHKTEDVAEQFKEIAKQYLLGKGLYLAVFKNALNHAEAELKKK